MELIATTTGGLRLLPICRQSVFKTRLVVRPQQLHCCETERLLPEEQRGFRLARSTIDRLFAVHGLQEELGRQGKIPLNVCFPRLI